MLQCIACILSIFHWTGSQNHDEWFSVIIEIFACFLSAISFFWIVCLLYLCTCFSFNAFIIVVRYTNERLVYIVVHVHYRSVNSSYAVNMAKKEGKSIGCEPCFL